MICRIKSMNKGKSGVKILSLPKNEQELNEALVDLGLDREKGYEHEVIFVKTRSKVIDETILHLKLRAEEVNLFARYYEDKTEKWDKDFERLLKIFQPTNAKDFLNLVYESMEYKFYKAKNIEEIGRKMLEQYPAMNKWSEKELGEMIHAQYNGKFVLDSLYMAKEEEFYEDGKPYYNGIAVEDIYFGSNNRDYVCSITMFNKDKYDAFLAGETEKPPSVTMMLPSTINEMARAMMRLGCGEVSYYVFPLTDTFPTDLAPKFSPGYINEFAELWLELEKEDGLITKLEAVLDYEGKEETIENLLEYYSVLENYKVYPHVWDYDELYRLRKKADTSIRSKEKKIIELNKYVKQYNGYLSSDYGLVLKTDGKPGIEELVEVYCL